MTKKYSTYNSGNGKGVYHENKRCDRIHDHERVTERSDEYVDWHGLTACEYCCGDDLDQPPNTSHDRNNSHFESLKEAAKND